jgi:vitamin B12 transporter
VPATGHAFTTINLAATYKYNETVDVFARIDNLLNARYENPVGFQRPGFAAYGGVRVSSF